MAQTIEAWTHGLRSEFEQVVRDREIEKGGSLGKAEILAAFDFSVEQLALPFVN